MNSLIQLYQGLESEMPGQAVQGQLYYNTDTQKMYIDIANDTTASSHDGQLNKNRFNINAEDAEEIVSKVIKSDKVNIEKIPYSSIANIGCVHLLSLTLAAEDFSSITPRTHTYYSDEETINSTYLISNFTPLVFSDSEDFSRIAGISLYETTERSESATSNSTKLNCVITLLKPLQKDVTLTILYLTEPAKTFSNISIPTWGETITTSQIVTPTINDDFDAGTLSEEAATV